MFTFKMKVGRCLLTTLKAGRKIVHLPFPNGLDKTPPAQTQQLLIDWIGD